MSVNLTNYSVNDFELQWITIKYYKILRDISTINDFSQSNVYNFLILQDLPLTIKYVERVCIANSIRIVYLPAKIQKKIKFWLIFLKKKFRFKLLLNSVIIVY